MRERESVSLTPALSRCLSAFATHLRHTSRRKPAVTVTPVISR
jgi:hypothetical protein